MIPLKKNWKNWNWKISITTDSPKRQTNNEIWHHQTLRTPDANPQKRDKKHPNPPLKGHKTPSVPPLVHQAMSIAQKVDRLTNRQVMPAGRVKKKGLKK